MVVALPRCRAYLGASCRGLMVGEALLEIYCGTLHVWVLSPWVEVPCW